MSKPRVVLAMSGGVDSSVAAHLLAEQFDVIGVFMRHGTEPPSASSCTTNTPPQSGIGSLPIIEKANKQGCCSALDAEDARRVADALQIPFYALNLREDFEQIMDYFVDEYEHGRTPNPCVMCNNILKFGKLFDYADMVDAEYVATGHYARLQTRYEQLELLRGIDGHKDQSYVLFGVDQRRLQRMLLPIGNFRKSEIREHAKKFGLNIANKPDSQEICFVSAGEHGKFVAAKSSRATAGQIVTTTGEVVGDHVGIENFTIGQRRGIGVAMGEPYFVVRIDGDQNQVVIGKKEALARRELTATGVNWLSPPRDEPFRCEAQIRYNSEATAATASIDPSGGLRIVFDEPRHGVAPGQAVVCYEGDRVLVGGWIRDTQ